MTMASVAVIIPVYNGEKFLAAAIESVLAQTLPAREILVVDDGSTDGTPAIACGYDGVQYHRLEKRGAATARNFGVSQTQTEFVAFLDADDVWTCDNLEAQVSYLQSRPNVGFAVCLQKMFLEQGDTPPAWVKPELFESEHPAFVPSALIVRRAFFEEIGEFNEAYGIACDQDWFARAQSAGSGLNVVPRTLLLRRIHANNDSSRSGASLKMLLQVVKGNIDRQRQQAQEADNQ